MAPGDVRSGFNPFFIRASIEMSGLLPFKDSILYRSFNPFFIRASIEIEEMETETQQEIDQLISCFNPFFIRASIEIELLKDRLSEIKGRLYGFNPFFIRASIEIRLRRCHSHRWCTVSIPSSSGHQLRLGEREPERGEVRVICFNPFFIRASIEINWLNTAMPFCGFQSLLHQGIN